jgi:hypothetical protein
MKPSKQGGNSQNYPSSCSDYLPDIEQPRTSQSAAIHLPSLHVRARDAAPAKWLTTALRVLILDNPTVGVDVHAKDGIWAIIRHWSAFLACPASLSPWRR